MKKLICGIGLVVMLAGCGGRLVNPNVSQAQAQRDWDECDYEARRSVPVPYGRGQTAAVIGASMQINDLRMQCMRLRGYQQQ